MEFQSESLWKSPLSRLLARGTSCEYSQASYLLDRSLQQPGPLAAHHPLAQPTRGGTGLAPSLTVLLFYISDAAQDHVMLRKRHYLPHFCLGRGLIDWRRAAAQTSMPGLVVMWPWILQDWEGSSGASMTNLQPRLGPGTPGWSGIFS